MPTGTSAEVLTFNMAEPHRFVSDQTIRMGVAWRAGFPRDSISALWLGKGKLELLGGVFSYFLLGIQEEPYIFTRQFEECYNYNCSFGRLTLTQTDIILTTMPTRISLEVLSSNMAEPANLPLRTEIDPTA